MNWKRRIVFVEAELCKKYCVCIDVNLVKSMNFFQYVILQTIAVIFIHFSRIILINWN